MIPLLLSLVVTLAPPEEMPLRVVEASVYRTGIVYVVREGNVSAGVHTYRLSQIPEALDNTLWYGSPDDVGISDVETRLNINEETQKTQAATIYEMLSHNIGKTVRLTTRGSTLAPHEVIEGKILSYGGNGELTLAQADGKITVVGMQEVRSIDAKGLDMTIETKKVSPKIDVMFRTEAGKPGKVRFVSLELGAAWNAAYWLDLVDNSANVTAKAQVATGSLEFENTDLKLISGMPKLTETGRLDLTTGLNGLRGWLRGSDNTALAQKNVDPYERLAAILARQPQFNNMYGGYGGGMGGGFGGGGNSDSRVDYITYDPTDNSLVVRNDPKLDFIRSAIAATRLEDLHIYPMEKTSLPPGARLTRVLSKTKSAIENKYIWEINLLPDNSVPDTIRRVMTVTNDSGAPWPVGAAFITRSNVPLAQVTMPFTAAGLKADLELGTVEDVKKERSTREVSRELVALPDRYYKATAITEEVTLTIQNTRREVVPLEVGYTTLGRILTAPGGKITKTSDYPNAENPSMRAFWRLELQPGDKRELKVTYKHIV